jgi:hypothetical protein
MKLKIREFSKAEFQDRVEKRRKGQLDEPPPATLATVDSNRKRIRTYVTMDPTAKAIAKKIGNGVISRGIDRALFHFGECEHAARRRGK